MLRGFSDVWLDLHMLFQKSWVNPIRTWWFSNAWTLLLVSLSVTWPLPTSSLHKSILYTNNNWNIIWVFKCKNNHIPKTPLAWKKLAKKGHFTIYEWMVIRNDPVTVKHTKWIFTDVGKVMVAFILATDFDFIAYVSKMAFFASFFHANGDFGIWFQWFLLFCMIYCITVTCHCNTVKLVKAHTNEYRFLHTFGFHKNCSALRER